MRLNRIVGILCILITLLVVGSAHSVRAVPPVQDAVWNITYPTEGSVISGEVEVTLLAHELAGEIALADGDPDDAADGLERGIRLGRSARAGMYVGRLERLLARVS